MESLIIDRGAGRVGGADAVLAGDVRVKGQAIQYSGRKVRESGNNRSQALRIPEFIQQTFISSYLNA